MGGSESRMAAPEITCLKDDKGNVDHCCLPGRVQNIVHSLKTGLSTTICVT